MIENIHWLGAGGFAILGRAHIYINPRRITRPTRPADLVLVGQASYEYCSTADIDKLRGDSTVVLAGESACKQIGADVMLRPWQSTSANAACVKAVPILSADGLAHPDGDIGFVISTQVYDIYYAGDTRALPQNSTLQPDIVIVPLNGADGLSEALTASLSAMRPRWIIPYRPFGNSRIGQHEVSAITRAVGGGTEIVLPQAIG